MSFIRLPNIEPVPVSEEEGAIIRRYFQSLDHAKGARKLPFFSVAVCGSSGVGKKALLERVSIDTTRYFVSSFADLLYSTFMASFHARKCLMIPHSQRRISGKS